MARSGDQQPNYYHNATSLYTAQLLTLSHHPSPPILCYLGPSSTHLALTLPPLPTQPTLPYLFTPPNSFPHFCCRTLLTLSPHLSNHPFLMPLAYLIFLYPSPSPPYPDPPLQLPFRITLEILIPSSFSHATIQ